MRQPGEGPQARPAADGGVLLPLDPVGLVGALAVVAVFALFLWRGIRTALLAPDRFGMLLSIGIVTSIVAQALFNISVVLSLVPTKGIPLPFISYGGSSLVPTLAAVGILLNVSQHASGNIADFRLPIANLKSSDPSIANWQLEIGNHFRFNMGQS